MARLHHITRQMLSRGDPPPTLQASASWRPSRPSGDEPVPAWFSLTPRAPSADTRVADGSGLVATLETSGGVTGPGAGPLSPSEAPGVVLGCPVVAPGSPAPAAFDSFRHDCTVRLSVYASGLARGRQALVVVGVQTESPEVRVIVQSFAGLVPVAEDTVCGDDGIAFSIDAGDDGKLAVRLVLRLCDSGPRTRLGVRGAVGYLL